MSDDTEIDYADPHRPLMHRHKLADCGCCDLLRQIPRGQSVCDRCRKAARLFTAAKAANSTDVLSVGAPFAPHAWKYVRGDSDRQLGIALDDLVASMHRADVVDPPNHGNVYFTCADTGYGPRLHLTARQVKAIDALHKTVKHIADRCYSDGMRDGTNMLHRLNDGSLALDDFVRTTRPAA